MSLSGATKSRILAVAATNMKTVIHHAAQRGFLHPPLDPLRFQELAGVAEEAAEFYAPMLDALMAPKDLLHERKVAANRYAVDAEPVFGPGFITTAGSD